MKHSDIINRYKDLKTQEKDDLLIHSLTHESCKKSFTSIHHPTSHKEISSTTLYFEKVNVTENYMNPPPNTSKSEVFIQILN